jgi:hypothetical protein
MLNRYILVLLILSFTASLDAQDLQWQSMNGPYFVSEATSISLGWTDENHADYRIYSVGSDFDYKYIYNYWGDPYSFMGWRGEPYRLDGVKHIGASRDNGNRAYATVPEGEGSEEGVHYTIDGGEAWGYNLSSQPENTRFTSIAVHPTNADICFTSASSRAGVWSVWRTVNGGSSWEAIGNEELFQPGETANKLKINPGSGNDIGNTIIYVCFINEGIWKNDAGGADEYWERLDIPGNNQGYDGIDIAVSNDENDRDRLVAIIDYQGTRQTWRSTDGGENWERLKNGSYELFYPYSVSEVAVGYFDDIDHGDCDQIWALSEDALVTATVAWDDGYVVNSYIKSNDLVSSDFSSIALDPYTNVNGERIFVAGSHRIFWSDIDVGGGFPEFDIIKGAHLADIKSLDSDFDHRFSGVENQVFSIGSREGYIFGDGYYRGSYSYKYNTSDIHGQGIKYYPVREPPYPDRSYVTIASDGAGNAYILSEQNEINYGGFDPVEFNALAGPYFPVSEDGVPPLIGGIEDNGDNRVYLLNSSNHLENSYFFGSVPPQVTDLYYSYPYIEGQMQGYFACGNRNSPLENIVAFIYAEHSALYLNDGLEGINKANAIIESQDYGNSTYNCVIYLATEGGIFKNYFDFANATPWHAVNDGINAGVKITRLSNYQHILADPDYADNRPDSIVEYAMGHDEIDNPYIYVSPDSGRTWIEFGSYFRDLNLAVNDMVTQNDNGYSLAVATNKGLYQHPYNVYSGTVSQSETWGPGLVIINGDITVEAGCALRIANPCTVLVTYDFDRLESGQTSTKSEIIVEGSVTAIGEAGSPIVFMSSKPSDPETDDWRGFSFMNGSSGNFAYCTFEHCDYGIYMNANSSIVANYCHFKDIGNAGIYNDRGDLDVEQCEFEDIHYYGIYTNYGKSEIDNSTFICCESYGIVVDNDPIPVLDSVIITDNTIQTGDDWVLINSQYAIRSSKADKVRIEGNTMKTYNQGGIFLHVSNAILLDNTVQLMGNHGFNIYNSTADIDDCEFSDFKYGIYLGGGGSSKINHNNFDPVEIGIYINGTTTVPDIGNTVTEDGNNDFENCSKYYICQSAFPEPLIKAENNYYGQILLYPKPEFFKGRIDYDPWILSDPFLRLAFIGDLPIDYCLEPNFPNPFNPQTNISYSLANPGYTTINVFNVLGQKITTLISEYQEAGNYMIVWNGTSSNGEPVSSGIYFYQIKSGDFVESRKMSLLR